LTNPGEVSDLSALWAAPSPSAQKAQPHYHGHRERLRTRALDGGCAALPDYELLELFLFRAIPRGDVKPLAKALLTRFGSLGGVLGATIPELVTVKGVGESVALDLKLLHEASLRTGREAVSKRPVITSSAQLAAYVKPPSPMPRANSSASCSSTRRTSSSPTR